MFLDHNLEGLLYDVGENLKKELEEGEKQYRKGKRPSHSKKKKE